MFNYTHVILNLFGLVVSFTSLFTAFELKGQLVGTSTFSCFKFLTNGVAFKEPVTPHHKHGLSHHLQLGLRIERGLCRVLSD